MDSDEEDNWTSDGEAVTEPEHADQEPDQAADQEPDQEQQEDQIEAVAGTPNPSTVLDLILLQRIHEESGVRLAFHNDIQSKIKMETTPYFACALQGLTNLAAVLHERGIPCDPDMAVASFSARGRSNHTPWQKQITVSPSEVALLAGYSATSKVLQRVQEGTPVLWTPQTHSSCPPQFRRKVRVVMAALCSSPFFMALPGPARVSIVHHTVGSMSRSQLWGPVTSESGLWGEPRVVQPEQAAAWKTAGALTSQGKKAAEEDGEHFPVFNLRIGFVRVGRLRRMANIMSRLTAGGAAVRLSRSLGCFSLLPTTGVFFAAFLSPVPALLLMSSFKLHQHINQPAAPGG